MLYSLIIDTAKHTIIVAGLVFAMMMWVDYINTSTRGRLTEYFKNKKSSQYVVSALAGIVPGCVGCFFTVSCYTHRIFTIGALTAGLIASSGDEAFVMIAMFPKEALLLFGILFVVGIIFGVITDYLNRDGKLKSKAKTDTFEVHEDEVMRPMNLKQILQSVAKPIASRLLLGLAFALLLLSVMFGWMGPEEWEWERISFLIIFAASFALVIVTPNHYLKEHIWGHIAKKHLARIVIWTFIALVIVNFGLNYWHVGEFVRSHMSIVFALALLIGIIPESGPNLVFVMLFAQGIVPFSILLTSSIAQSGHGLLPLLSHSLRDAITVKILCLIAALLVGGTFYAAGF